MKSQRLHCKDPLSTLSSDQEAAVDFATCRKALALDKEYTQKPLTRQLDQLQRACARHSPTAAAQARRLEQMLAFIEHATQSSIAAGPAIRSLTNDLTRVRIAG